MCDRQLVRPRKQENKVNEKKRNETTQHIGVNKSSFGQINGFS